MTTVVVVEVGGATGSVTVVVRRTVVVSVVGGGVETTSSLEHAPQAIAAPINRMIRDRVFMYNAKTKVRACAVSRI